MESLKELGISFLKGPLFKYLFVFLVVAFILILQNTENYWKTSSKKIYANIVLIIWTGMCAILVGIGVWLILESKGQDITSWFLFILFSGLGIYLLGLIIRLFRHLNQKYKTKC